jgi:antitoxin (DNA-binding transcriptional repressor) of toxin-antitoxin stability system
MGLPAILKAMTTFTIAEAETQLASLIDRALNGEAVVIAQTGRQPVEIKPMRPAALPPLARKRARLQAGSDPVALAARLRDEDWR